MNAYFFKSSFPFHRLVGSYPALRIEYNSQRVHADILIVNGAITRSNRLRHILEQGH